MKATVNREQLKALVIQAMISFLEDDVRVAPALNPAAQQCAPAHASLAPRRVRPAVQRAACSGYAHMA